MIEKVNNLWAALDPDPKDDSVQRQHLADALKHNTDFARELKAQMGPLSTQDEAYADVIEQLSGDPGRITQAEFYAQVRGYAQAYR